MIKTKFIDGKIVVNEIYEYIDGKEVYGGKVSRDLSSSKNKAEIEYSEDYKKILLSIIDDLKEHLSDLNSSDITHDRECSFVVMRSSLKSRVISLNNIRVPEKSASKCKCNTHTIMSMGCQCSGK